jgi:hypothetical protein
VTGRTSAHQGSSDLAQQGQAGVGRGANPTTTTTSVGRAGGYSLEMSSLVVFSIDVPRLAMFYESVLGATPLGEPSDDIRLMSERDEVLIHSIPKRIALEIKVTSPPVARGNSALKPVFDVASLENALASVEARGGVVTSTGFSSDGLTRRDVLDPEGNVIQLRCRTS